ncbi:hypothetical protein BDF20DRAFT_899983 [Mycotypha africana]|uniref:uncharacterized protein n=1 Tax=Mycotypha africana TaxID=64632 RepID=UPI00230102BF|nr:uncharacterized protein BDF20DRAFT_899983 [Mycotypha africana]KAI8967559.1 hypothetical protein BDF20DRAFT_899983 [Mycotypha africana]
MFREIGNTIRSPPTPNNEIECSIAITQITQKWFLLIVDVVSSHFQQPALNLMAALGYFLTLHAMNQVFQEQWKIRR